MSTKLVVSTLSALALCAGAFAQDAPPPADKKVQYSPYPQQNFPNRVFFGDTHLHTSYSTDAGMIGNTSRAGGGVSLCARRDGEIQHRIARAAQSAAGFPGRRGSRRKPGPRADDRRIEPGSAQVRVRPQGVRPGQGRQGLEAYNAWGAAMIARQDPLKGMPMARTAWERITAAAEKYNEPGRFTAFIGYEWTSAPEGNNLHRSRHLSRRQGQGRSGPAVLAIRQRRCRGSLEMDGRLREENRRPAACHPAQRQSFQWAHVRRRHAHDQEAARSRLCAAARRSGSRCTK